MRTSICLLLPVITFASVAVAQTKKDNIEVGVQSTSLTLFPPDFPDFVGDVTHAGVGGRVTYNLNRSIAAEAEINFFPQKPFLLSADGNMVQAQFGVKLGKRFEKFGLFAKVRPGFLSVDKVFSLEPGPLVLRDGILTPNFKVERTTFFTIDAGGVLELYPSKRTVVRFEAGDTAIRHPARFDLIFSDPPLVQLIRPAKFTHNFQFTAGVAFRLGDFPAAESDPQTPVKGRERTSRFELGAQFTSLFVNPPSDVPQLGLLTGEGSVHVEPGFGARFTFNLTENIGLEAEGNYYTRNLFRLPNPSGHMFQGQFGAKIGKRFDKWGLFAKARPGFVGFTRVNELVRIRTIQTVAFGPVMIADFRVAKKRYPSIDLGGVMEFYVSPRWMVRFDVGDTIIRYGELNATGFSVRVFLSTRPPETRHNLQVSSGIGFRF